MQGPLPPETPGVLHAEDTQQAYLIAVSHSFNHSRQENNHFNMPPLRERSWGWHEDNAQVDERNSAVYVFVIFELREVVLEIDHIIIWLTFRHLLCVLENVENALKRRNILPLAVRNNKAKYLFFGVDKWAGIPRQSEVSVSRFNLFTQDGTPGISMSLLSSTAISRVIAVVKSILGY